ncbi:hypothetical protein Fmac_017798 [Flemingia macrophylla]|uniref:Protein kinase domain-containing protein n=1 Tax=Flemingia macrophylla TaxID=520843 RepID=A0ABD1M336_9FABA
MSNKNEKLVSGGVTNLTTNTMLLKCLGERSSSRRKYPTVIEELCPQFSLSDLRKSTNNFDENNVIGLTRFRKIYKGCLECRDAPDVALKRFNVKDSRACELFKNEIELFCQLRHPNCISLKGFCNHKKEKIIVYEHMSNGSLYKHLGEGKLSWKKRLEICIGAARGLHYLHTGVKRSIFHRDFRPSSILLDHNMEPKLSNFDLCLKGPHFLSKPKPIKVDHIEECPKYPKSDSNNSEKLAQQSGLAS